MSAVEHGPCWSITSNTGIEPMKFASITIAVCSLVLMAGMSFAQDKPTPTVVTGDIDWVFDLESGQALSQETGKPMFIVFRCER